MTASEAQSQPFIVRRQDYQHYPSGLVLNEHKVVSGTAPDDFGRFTATVVHNMRLPNGEPIQGKAQVGIPADTLTEAFELLPDLIKKAAGEIEAKLQKQLRPAIVLPGPPLINRNGGRM